MLQYGKLSISLELIEIHWKECSETAMLHMVTHFLTRVATTVRFVGPPTPLGGLRDASEENPILYTSGFAP